MNSATTQHPLHDTPQGVSLRFCCVAPPSPRHHAFCFVWRDFLFVFSVWWWRERGRVSPKGETGGIQIADSVLPKLFSGGKDLAKPRLIFRPQKGVWGMNAGGFLNSFLAGLGIITFLLSTKLYFLYLLLLYHLQHNFDHRNDKPSRIEQKI